MSTQTALFLTTIIIFFLTTALNFYIRNIGAWDTVNPPCNVSPPLRSAGTYSFQPVLSATSTSLPECLTNPLAGTSGSLNLSPIITTHDFCTRSVFKVSRHAFAFLHDFSISFITDFQFYTITESDFY